jgi:triacylglycerol lipase
MSVPRLRAPIVLVHGLLGYDQWKLCGWTLANYFGCIPTSFTDAGNRVFVAALSKTRGVADRANQLKAFLDLHSPEEPVHLIGHSMGGLDARYMISCLGMADRVLSLTTIGTPHRGTAFADWGVRKLAKLIVPFFEKLCVPYQAFFDLTTANCRDFNEKVPDAPAVRYFSVAGKHQGTWLSPEWELPHRIVTRVEGDNDGIVSVTSANYGESCDIWPGDHISLVNWISPLAHLRGQYTDRTPAYAALLGRLADAGF